MVDTDKLAAYKLSIEDVRRRSSGRTWKCPAAGSIKARAEWSLRTLGRLNNADRVQRPDRRQPQRLPDPHPRRRRRPRIRSRSRARWPGSTAATPSAWSCKSSRAPTRSRWPTTSRPARTESAPPCRPTSQIEIIRDQSRFIKKSIEEVKFHLLLAAVLVSATILLFIRDWRTTMIATLAIPDVDHADVSVHVLHGLHAQQHHDARA